MEHTQEEQDIFARMHTEAMKNVPPPPEEPIPSPIPSHPSAHTPSHPPIKPSQSTDTEPTISSLIGRDSFEFQGYVWRLGPVVPSIKADFEQLCWANEARGIEAIRTAVDWASYMDYRQEFLRGIVSKKWAWNSPDSKLLRQQDSGLKDLYWLVLRHWNNPRIASPIMPLHPNQPIPQVTFDLIESIWEDIDRAKELHVKMQALMDPNPMAPIQ